MRPPRRDQATTPPAPPTKAPLVDLADHRGGDEQRHRDEHGEEGDPDEDARSGARVVPDHRRE